MSQQMACALCVEDPRMHNFVPLGPLPTGARLFYTAPARVRDLEHAGKLALFHQHLRAAERTPWVWVFDCGQMEMRHYASLEFTMGLSRILEAEHGTSLQCIYVVRPNLFARGTLSILQWMLPNSTLRKVRVIADDDPYWLAALRMEHGFSAANTAALESITRLPLDAVLPPFL